MIGDAELQVLLDRMGISDTVIRYATGADTRDWALFRSCFTDEVDIDFTSLWGGNPRHLTGDEWVERVRTRVSRYKSAQHVSTNHVIELNGDKATCVSYAQARHYFPLATGEHCFIVGGFYTNTLVRTPQGWKIRKLELTVTWTEGARSLYDQLHSMA